MNKFDELRNQKNATVISVNKDIEHLRMVAQESKRVANVACNTGQIVEEIDREFAEVTKLNMVDISFLFIAVALQCLRQYIITNDAIRFNNASDADKVFKKPVDKIVKDNNISKRYTDILLGPVPYDAVSRADTLKELGIQTGVSGANHRYKVLGHDPLLGWLFGTLNIMTCSLTKNEMFFPSYRVLRQSNQISDMVGFTRLIEEGIQEIINDWKILIVSVTKQAIHLGSDAFTKMGLPIPVINSVVPDLNSKLLSKECRIDSYSVCRGVLLASLINWIIAAVHRLFYDAEKYSNHDLYEVKTRKILSYSNVIATSSNILYSVITKNLKTLDVGGFIVTIYRLVNDYQFRRDIKIEFLSNKFAEIVQGVEYNF